MLGCAQCWGGERSVTTSRMPPDGGAPRAADPRADPRWCSSSIHPCVSMSIASTAIGARSGRLAATSSSRDSCRFIVGFACPPYLAPCPTCPHVPPGTCSKPPTYHSHPGDCEASRPAGAVRTNPPSAEASHSSLGSSSSDVILPGAPIALQSQSQ